jgi:hypothetical protein
VEGKYEEKSEEEAGFQLVLAIIFIYRGSLSFFLYFFFFDRSTTEIILIGSKVRNHALSLSIALFF